MVQTSAQFRTVYRVTIMIQVQSRAYYHNRMLQKMSSGEILKVHFHWNILSSYSLRHFHFLHAHLAPLFFSLSL